MLRPKHWPLWPKFTHDIKNLTEFIKVDTENAKTDKNKCCPSLNITKYVKVDKSQCSSRPKQCPLESTNHGGHEDRQIWTLSKLEHYKGH